MAFWKQMLTITVALTGCCIMPIGGTVTLEQLSTTYIPYYQDSTWGKVYDLDLNAVETSVYDPTRALIYAVGANGYLYVIDASNPTNLTNVYHKKFHPELNGAYTTDVKLCNRYVFVTVQYRSNVDHGFLTILSPYLGSKGFVKVDEIAVGSFPAQMAFTNDCETLVIANEGRLTASGPGEYHDAEGSISILKLKYIDGTYSRVLRHKTLDFTQYNDRHEQYQSMGVRYLYSGLDQTPLVSTFSQDLEPKSVTLSKDGTRAYVSLQENNAIAVIDVNKEAIVDLYPLGTKKWKNYSFDGSKIDGGNLNNKYDLFGMYQPDGIQYFEAGGVGYIATANEGAAKHYRVDDDGLTWSEIITGKTLSGEKMVHDTVSQSLGGALNSYYKLGNLEISRLEGRQLVENRVYYTQFYTFGGRGIAVWRADDLQMMYESGNETESMHYKYALNIFNGHMESEANTPKQDKDTRSSKRGPEPESLELVEIGEDKYMFVGHERTSTIMVYKMTKDSYIPVFESLYRAGSVDNTWRKMYEARDSLDVGQGVGDIDPEGLQFIPASQSPNCKPLLLVTGAVSSTISLYSVNGLPEAQPDECIEVSTGIPNFVTLPRAETTTTPTATPTTTTTVTTTTSLPEGHCLHEGNIYSPGQHIRDGYWHEGKCLGLFCGQFGQVSAFVSTKCPTREATTTVHVPTKSSETTIISPTTKEVTLSSGETSSSSTTSKTKGATTTVSKDNNETTIVSQTTEKVTEETVSSSTTTSSTTQRLTTNTTPQLSTKTSRRPNPTRQTKKPGPVSASSILSASIMLCLLTLGTFVTLSFTVW